MPAGVQALEALGVRSRLESADCAPFTGVRYVQEDGTSAVGRLARPGLGIRRTALSRALRDVAVERGATLLDRETVRHHRVERDAVVIDTDGRSLRAKVLVAADGLHSSVRRAAGMEGLPSPVRRFGMRRHFARAPWSSEVEVHFAVGVEAYVTPCGSARVGIALLWEDGRVPPPMRFDALLDGFPVLRRRLVDAPPDSLLSGAGPLWQRARTITSNRVVLLGDAAGYVDALTGEGVSLALSSASRLARILPAALKGGAGPEAFAGWERGWRAEFNGYARLAQSLLWLSRRPHLRRRAIHALGRIPGLFDGLLEWTLEAA